MTTNQTHSQSKTRDRHASDRLPRGDRPSADAGSRSADEIRADVKEAVGKGVAAVAGAVEGVDETLTETQLADTAESAVRQVGETATKVVRAAKESTTDIKQAFRGEGPEDIDLETERGDPTFGAGDFSSGLAASRAKPGSRGPGAYDLGQTEASSSGRSLESDLEDSSYDKDEDDGRSQGI